MSSPDRHRANDPLHKVVGRFSLFMLKVKSAVSAVCRTILRCTAGMGTELVSLLLGKLVKLYGAVEDRILRFLGRYIRLSGLPYLVAGGLHYLVAEYVTRWAFKRIKG